MVKVLELKLQLSDQSIEELTSKTDGASILDINLFCSAVGAPHVRN